MIHQRVARIDIDTGILVGQGRIVVAGGVRLQAVLFRAR
jgi:hypothetical protein